MATGTQNAATPGDEPMDEEHRNILRRCRETLVEDMEPRQVLIKMVDPLLFTKEDESIVKGSGLTREEQCEILLDILPRKGAKAYEVFKETIAKVHPHLTETILRAGKYFHTFQFSQVGLNGIMDIYRSNICVESVSY